MKHTVVVPQVGESITSGVLAVWYKQSGDSVSEGEELFELETDKATLPVPSPVTGVVTVLVEADTEVQVGTEVAIIDDAAAAHTSPGSGADKAAVAGSDSPEPAAPEPAVQSGVEVPPATEAPALTPAARRLIEENNLDSAAIRGTGPKGNVTKGDVLAHLESVTSGGGAASHKTPASAVNPASEVSAAPAVKPAPEAKPAPGASPAPLPPAKHPQERVKMTTIRRTIAQNLVRSKRDSAHLTTFNEVDISAVIAMRATYRDAFEAKHGVRLGFMSFFLKAAQGALESFREINAFVDGDEIVYNNVVNIGVAISTDAGLVVPVVRDVASRSFADIERAIADFTERAKKRRILPDEFAGGTFTVSNGGVFGSMLSTPIPNPPQSGVLGMHAIQKRAVVVGDEIAIRPMMYLALTYDHRIVDGRGAIGFLNAIKDAVEDPSRLLLAV